MNKKITYTIIVFFCFFLKKEILAQLSINSTTSPTQLVEKVLLGYGVKASNITFTGNSNLNRNWPSSGQNPLVSFQRVYFACKALRALTRSFLLDHLLMLLLQVHLHHFHCLCFSAVDLRIVSNVVFEGRLSGSEVFVELVDPFNLFVFDRQHIHELILQKSFDLNGCSHRV